MFILYGADIHRHLHSFPTRRSSDLVGDLVRPFRDELVDDGLLAGAGPQHSPDSLQEFALPEASADEDGHVRSEEHTSELQSRRDLVCRLLLEKKKQKGEGSTRAMSV